MLPGTRPTSTVWIWRIDEGRLSRFTYLTSSVVNCEATSLPLFVAPFILTVRRPSFRRRAWAQMHALARRSFDCLSNGVEISREGG